MEWPGKKKTWKMKYKQTAGHETLSGVSRKISIGYRMH